MPLPWEKQPKEIIKDIIESLPIPKEFRAYALGEETEGPKDPGTFKIGEEVYIEITRFQPPWEGWPPIERFKIRSKIIDWNSHFESYYVEFLEGDLDGEREFYSPKYISRR